MNWEELESAAKQCRRCALCETRRNVVFGVGRRDASVLFVGEGPGEQEDIQGEPFVGRAGKLLDDMLAVIGLHRSRVYIANIVKCRPPGNRDPLPAEQDACIDWLRRQTALMRPRILVCLGRIAAARIIKSDFRITKEHGVVFARGEYKLMAMYHPSYLLRSPHRRPEAFDDLKALESLIAEADPDILQ